MIDVTIQMDADYNLWIWKGKVQPQRISHSWIADGRACDLLVTNERVVTDIMDSLSDDEFDIANRGKPCYTVLEPEYF